MILALQAFAGIALLFFGGSNLVHGAVSISSRLGLQPLVIGLTVVAFGTSAPELTVSISAALKGSSAISIGNVVGSNIANLGLILGLAALLYPLKVKARIFRIDAPIMLGTAVLLSLFLGNGLVGALEGSVLLSGLIFFIIFTLYLAKRQPEEVQEEFDEAITGSNHFGFELARIVLGLFLLTIGASLLVTSTVAFAGYIGLSEAVIGLTIVAIGTSLPEMSASLMAARNGYGDVAIGNIIGSNIFNTLGILGITGIILPMETGTIELGEILIMVFISALAGVFFFTSERVDRYEGFILVSIFTVYTGWLLIR